MFHDMIGFEASISGLCLETNFFLPHTDRHTDIHTKLCMEVAPPHKKRFFKPLIIEFIFEKKLNSMKMSKFALFSLTLKLSKITHFTGR